MDLKGNRATWVGHGTWVWATSEGKRLMIDPWLAGNPAAPDALKDPGALDAVLITHGHFDHVGDAVATITSTSAPAFANFEVATWLESKGCQNVTPMNKGGTVDAAGVKATMVHALHSGAITDEGKLLPGGEAAGWVLEFPDGLVVYHAGDTDVFGDMALIGEVYSPDVAVLPIGDHFTMGPRQAAHAVRLLGVKQIIPTHFATFPLLHGTPAELRGLVGSGVEVADVSPGATLP